MRISDWSSDVCSSDLQPLAIVRRSTSCRCSAQHELLYVRPRQVQSASMIGTGVLQVMRIPREASPFMRPVTVTITADQVVGELDNVIKTSVRSEEHTSELQSLMRISYAVFCLN